MTLVVTKSDGATIERSTWLSAARWTTVSISCSAKMADMRSPSRMSAWMNVYRGGSGTVARLAGFPA